MINAFMVLLPVFGIIAFGYLLHRYDIVKIKLVHILNLFIYYVSLPALIISLFWNIEFTKSTLGFFGFHAGLIIVLSLILMLTLSIFKINSKNKIAIMLGVMVGNTVYMGYPILGATYPDFPIEVGIGAGAIQLITGLLMAVLFVEYMILRTKKLSTYILDLARNPLVIACILGVILSLIPHSEAMNAGFKVVSALGQTASPLALLTLGFFMNRHISKKSIMLGSIAVMAKLVILPMAVFIISILLGYSREFIQVSVLISAMPTAVTSFILAEKYNLDENLSADIILASTIFSIISIPIVVWLLG